VTRNRVTQEASLCSCCLEDGCAKDCYNRIMAYECDEQNCKLTATQCGNRPFAELERRAKGNGYDYGVEVMKTVNCGYGLRAMRTFEPRQVVVEFAGEVITPLECDRRMTQVYSGDKVSPPSALLCCVRLSLSASLSHEFSQQHYH
jgi:palmitoyltransferase ZDHHC9/14/18